MTTAVASPPMINPLETRAPVEAGADLIARAQTGDQAAFDGLCREHAARLFSQALLLCGDRSAAEDLVQETLVAAWRSLGRYHGGCRFFTWLCSILIHRHRTAARRRWPLPFSSLWRGDEQEARSKLDTWADEAELPPASAENHERARELRRSLERLPARLRECVYLRYYADDTLEGIAAALGCPVGTVKSRLYHGLERLRRMKAVAEQRMR